MKQTVAEMLENQTPITTQDSVRVRKELGRILFRLRKTAKVSQVQLAKLLSLHQAAVCRVENGNQNLTPAELFAISRFFNVPIDSILANDVDYSSVAKRFGRQLPMPKRYLEYSFSKARDVLPLLHFLYSNCNELDVQRVFDSLDLDPGYLVNPDQEIGAYCFLDIVSYLLSHKLLTRQNIKKVIDQTKRKEVQGFLLPLYKTQTNSISLLKTFILNRHHYNSNFLFDVDSCSGNSITVTVEPARHMEKVDYKNEILEDFICFYRKAYISALPLFINEKPATITESECHFKGAKKCAYKIKIAS
ncbi:MAG: helix-turn-helix domain-containing protein [Bacteriovoracia bacterium]